MVFIANIVEFLIELLVLPAYPGTRETLKIANGVVTLALPLAIFVGQVRGNVFAAMSLGQIAVRARGKPLTPVAVQKVTGDALGDRPSRSPCGSQSGPVTSTLTVRR